MTTLSFRTALLSILLIALTCNVFAQSNQDGDDRMKIRLGFNSVNNFHRQILVTVDNNATPGVDFGYDAQLYGSNQDDMYWMIDNNSFVIQGIDNIQADSILPIGLHTSVDGVNTILIDELINAPEALEVLVYDTVTNTYHDIKNNSGFSIDLPAGSYLNRFELRFENVTNTNDDVSTTEEGTLNETQVISNNKPFKIAFINKTKSILIKDLGIQELDTVEIYDLTGQLNAQFSGFENEGDSVNIQTDNLASGQYVVVVTTNTKSISKSILVK